MTLAEAKDLIEKAYPGQGVTLGVEKGVCRIRAKDGTELGAAFSWLPAVRQAVKPVLDAQHADKVAQFERDKERHVQFLRFLKEYLKAPFEEWLRAEDEKRKQSADQAGDAAGTPKLVVIP